MEPLIYEGYIIAVDTADTDHAKLVGKLVVAWHKSKGLTLCWFKLIKGAEVLVSENSLYGSIVLSREKEWRVIARVLWWIGKAP